MQRYAVGFFIFVVLGMLLTGAVAVEETRPGGITGTGRDLNMTGAAIENQTFPHQYGVYPTLIAVKVGISETVLPGPKGEMAAGPRTIGFAADPVSLALLALTILGASAGVWYLVKRRSEETGDDEEETGE